MKKQSQSARFGVVGAILIVAIAIALGYLGYYLYTQNQTAQNKNTTEQTKEYAEIKEWGVKVALRDASKINITVIEEKNELANGLKFDAFAAPSFKPEFLKNKDCSPGLALYRSKTEIEGFESKKIGDYYYAVTGGQARCSDDPENNPDDQLKTRFAEDFIIENVTLK